MKSPTTGKEMSYCTRTETLKYKGEDFDIIYHYYLDNDTNEEFTDEKLDTLNTNQVYEQYKIRHNDKNNS